MRTPAREATQLLSDFEITTLPVNPVTLCERLGIHYREEPLDGLDGLILSLGGQTLIAVSTRIKNLHRKRFTCAHEIGHFIFDFDNSPLVLSKEGETSFEVNAPAEMEKRANEFASHLLMPMSLLPKSLRSDDPSWGTVSFISELCETSLSAAALRLIKITELPCHLVCLKERKVLWSFSSNSTSKRVQTRVEKKLIAKNDWFRVPFSDWFYDSMWDRGRYLLEWGLPPNKFGNEYVLLWEEELEDEENNDEE